MASPRQAAEEAQVVVHNWSALPGDLVRLVGGCVLAAQDLDHYASFCAVCPKWRSETDNPKEKGLTDRRFVPTKWVLLIKQCTENDSITLVNVDSGRFLVRSMSCVPDKCFLAGATNGGLFLLGKTAYPHQARVLNPFTGSIAHFKASIPSVGEIRGVVVTTSPIRVFVFVSSDKENNRIMWADPDSECFREFRVLDYLESPRCMAPVADNVYLTDLYGSIASTDFSRPFPTMKTTIPGPEKLLPESLENDRYYLVKSEEDLLLVTRPWRGLPKELVVRRVDIKRKVLEPVRNLGSYALFVSRIRCLAVDAAKFHTVEGGCVYFVDPIMNYGLGCYKSSFMTVFRVADGVQERMLQHLSAVGGYSLPCTLPLLFAEYCNSIPYYELCQDCLEEGELWDDFEPDEESSESDDELD